MLTVIDSQLPTLDNYHTLVALDTSHQKSATVFGFPGWVYKATSSKNGKMYCLRRLEGMAPGGYVDFEINPRQVIV